MSACEKERERQTNRDEPKFLTSVHPASITKSSLELWRLEGADNVDTFLRKEYIRILVQVSKVFMINMVQWAGTIRVTRLLELCKGTAQTRWKRKADTNRNKPKFLSSVNLASIKESSLKLWWHVRKERVHTCGQFTANRYCCQTDFQWYWMEKLRRYSVRRASGLV